MRAIRIPVDSAQPLEEVTLPDVVEGNALPLINDIRLKLAADFEIVRTRQLHALLHGEQQGWTRYPTIAMLVDEDGWRHGLTLNVRATCFYDGQVVGDALLMGEIQVDGAGDISSLPDIITIEQVQKMIETLSGKPRPNSEETVGQDVEPR